MLQLAFCLWLSPVWLNWRKALFSDTEAAVDLGLWGLPWPHDSPTWRANSGLRPNLPQNDPPLKTAHEEAALGQS